MAYIYSSTFRLPMKMAKMLRLGILLLLLLLLLVSVLADWPANQGKVCMPACQWIEDGYGTLYQYLRVRPAMAMFPGAVSMDMTEGPSERRQGVRMCREFRLRTKIYLCRSGRLSCRTPSRQYPPSGNQLRCGRRSGYVRA